MKYFFAFAPRIRKKATRQIGVVYYCCASCRRSGFDFFIALLGILPSRVFTSPLKGFLRFVDKVLPLLSFLWAGLNETFYGIAVQYERLS